MGNDDDDDRYFFWWCKINSNNNNDKYILLCILNDIIIGVKGHKIPVIKCLCLIFSATGYY